jgi:hypothetical protein
MTRAEFREALGVVGYIAFFVMVIALMVFYYVSSYQENKENIEHDVHMRVVSINGDNSFITPDKFHTPKTCAVILFETLEEPSRYMQVDCMHSSLSHVSSPQWVYSHQAGDTVFFTQLRKDKLFFHSNPTPRKED